MGGKPTQPDRTMDVSNLAAQSEAFQHLEPTAAREEIRNRPDNQLVGQAIVGGGLKPAPAAGDPVFRDLAVRDPVSRGIRPPTPPGWFDKLEAFISRLSVRDNFWHSICSLLWLPLAFFSGIRLKELKEGSFAAQAILPFRRFNRNWYRAMAGGALLANSEIAGGAYVFGICGADYTVVCKNLNYTFLRPCLGPAVYRMSARENVQDLVKQGGEFNATIDMEVSQQGFKGERDRRVGKCEATFHVTPKVHHKMKKARKQPK